MTRELLVLVGYAALFGVPIACIILSVVAGIDRRMNGRERVRG